MPDDVRAAIEELSITSVIDARSALVQGWGEFTPDTVSLSDVAAARPAALKIMEEIDFDN